MILEILALPFPNPNFIRVLLNSHMEMPDLLCIVLQACKWVCVNNMAFASKAYHVLTLGKRL